MDRYKYRRQFIVGSRFWEDGECWEHTYVSQDLKLSVHKDLPLYELQKDGKKIILLGYMIDPAHPDFTDSDIIEWLLNESADLSHLIENTYRISGRWILIFVQNEQVIFLHDPFGMRQIYYANAGGEFWCGSQPCVLANCLNIKPDQQNESLNEFIHSVTFEKKERFWVGDKTRYREIRHLLPNHYLNASTGTVHRYWINREARLSLNEAAKWAGDILKNSLLSANKRFNLMMPVTAGWDSRVLLSASKEITDDLYYFISTKNHLTAEDHDIKVPKTLLSKLGLNFHVFKNLREPDSDFLETLNRNVDMARNLPKTLTFYEFYLHHQDKVNINGRGGETARCYYPSDNHPSAAFLAKVTGYPNNRFVLNEIENWLKDARPFAAENSVDLANLYYWEQRMGNWGCMDPAEQDIAIDEFCPFNNRKLIMILLSTKRKYRSRPDYRLHKTIISYLWKELFEEPVNPIPNHLYVKMLVNSKIPYVVKRVIKKSLNLYPYD